MCVGGFSSEFIFVKMTLRKKKKTAQVEVRPKVVKPNNDNTKNPDIDGICKLKPCDKRIHNSDIEDLILTDSEYKFVCPNAIRTSIRSPGTEEASTSFSTCTRSLHSLASDVDYEAEIADDLEVNDWVTIRKQDLTESIAVNSILQKYCKPRSKTLWSRFKHGVMDVSNKSHPKIVVGIQEANGGFFENIGGLMAGIARARDQGAMSFVPKRIKKQSKDAKKEDTEGSIEEPYEAILESDRNRDGNELLQNLYVEPIGWNIEKLYTSLVYMMQQVIRFNIAYECGRQCLLHHLQRAFKVDNETHKQVLEQAKNTEVQGRHLYVEVIDAKDLVSKDATGKSDPFCALYLDSASTKRYNTTVKQSTLSPVWEEHFELPLDNPETDMLHLEVWYSDAAEEVPEKMSKVKDVKVVRCIVKLVKKIAPTTTTVKWDNKFIGKCKIAVKDIPVTGHTMWYSLKKKNKSKPRGLVRLKLAFTIRAERDAQVAFQEHRHLLRILLLHELETEKVEKYCWCGRWSPAAEALILQHSAQRGLLARNVSLAQWVEYIRVHQNHPLSFTLLNTLAIELSRSIDNNPFSDDDMRLFWDAARYLLHSCLNGLREILRQTVGDKNTIAKLTAILGILSSLNAIGKPEDLDLFPAKAYDWLPKPKGRRTDIMQAFKKAVIQSGVERYEHVLKNNTPDGDGDENVLKYYIKVIQLIREDLERASKFYDEVFIKQSNFPYARTLYVYYEKRISDMCMIIVEDVCARLKRIEVENSDGTSEELALGTTLFELYLTLQRYAMLGHVLCADGLEFMKIQSYHQWFRAGVVHRLDIAVFKTLRWIERAIESDKLQPVTSNVRHSSSAVDTLGIFNAIKDFWIQLAWPDVEDSYTYIAKLIHDICGCSVKYADRMARKAEDATQQLQEMEKFEVSEAWCFAITNTDYIRTSIRSWAEGLGLKSILDALTSNKTQQEAERCQQAMNLTIDHAIGTVNDKVMKLLEVVATKMAPAMSSYLTEGAELFHTTINSMDTLLSYLDSSITTLQNNLNDTNFGRVLLVIWETMLNMLHDLVNNNLMRKRPPLFYEKLHQTLPRLIHLFNTRADQASNIHIPEKIEQLLKLHGLETAKLIHMYNQERLKEQTAIEKPIYGQLAVRAHLVDNMLNIQILNARNLAPMNSNGACDPYVMIRLLPEEKFVRLKLPRTKIYKANQCLFFDENFSISLSPEMRENNDAMVVFEVKDKDFFGSRFMAEAFLAFDEIPQTGPDRDFDSLEQIHLKLSRPTGRNSDVVRALEYRKGDGRAVDFISELNIKINTR